MLLGGLTELALFNNRTKNHILGMDLEHILLLVSTLILCGCVVFTNTVVTVHGMCILKLLTYVMKC